MTVTRHYMTIARDSVAVAGGEMFITTNQMLLDSG